MCINREIKNNVYNKNEGEKKSFFFIRTFIIKPIFRQNRHPLFIVNQYIFTNGQDSRASINVTTTEKNNKQKKNVNINYKKKKKYKENFK